MSVQSLSRTTDVLIVGAGLSGATIARVLAERGKKVEIWERRNHIAGNMYDYKDEHGILVHKYGPHTFHTNDKNLFDFINRFGEWEKYHLCCGAEIDGQFTPAPFNFSTIDTFFPKSHAEKLKRLIQETYKNRETFTVVEALESDVAEIREYAEFLFAKDYSLYTAKQWRVKPNEIDSSILKRVPLRNSYKDGYFDDAYQVMPRHTYRQFFERLLDHPNIEIKLNVEALKHLTIGNNGQDILIDGKALDVIVVYTGALDELFDCSYGSLPYRSLRFEWKHDEIDSFQNAPVVAYPQADDYTRITEYKKLPVQDVKGTTYAVEYSIEYEQGKNEPYYPVITEESKKLYNIYYKLANKINKFYYCGRLADFKYYNMDQVLARALEVANLIE